MNTHIDTLAQWWENAEVPKVIEAGDIVIEDRRHCEGGFEVWPAPRAHVETFDNRRILARAPKPKPAWHDAVAVIADVASHQRQVWVRESDRTYGCAEGYVVDDYELHNVTPLIEAKVTDETVDRVLDVLHAWNDTYPAGLGTKLAAAALGIEAE